MGHFTVCRHLLASIVTLIAILCPPGVPPDMDLWTVAFDFLSSVIEALQDVSSSSILVESQNNSDPRLLCVSEFRLFYHRSSLALKSFHFPRLEFFPRGFRT
ncbi:hypothetical protein BDZ89DRAFT_1059433 [Hymenopellis radicata]|nr:hypothetical protein BDZ89DRAFT_1059433 [Hymenopellis radicata]